MNQKQTITTLFLDIGGVLLTNGWDHNARKQAIKNFDLEPEEFEARHRIMNDMLETGKLTLKDYLKTVVFHTKRSFSPQEFQKFLFSRSKPYQEMIDLVSKLKTVYGLKIIVVSNEGRELTDFRIKKFKLDSFVDFFISSCFVHLRKPDLNIYRFAIDTAQVAAKEVLYIDDRQMFIEVAKGLGIKGIQHLDYATTRDKLAKFGFPERK